MEQGKNITMKEKNYTACSFTLSSNSSPVPYPSPPSSSKRSITQVTPRCLTQIEVIDLEAETTFENQSQSQTPKKPGAPANKATSTNHLVPSPSKPNGQPEPVKILTPLKIDIYSYDSIKYKSFEDNFDKYFRGAKINNYGYGSGAISYDEHIPSKPPQVKKYFQFSPPHKVEDICPKCGVPPASTSYQPPPEVGKQKDLVPEAQLEQSNEDKYCVIVPEIMPESFILSNYDFPTFTLTLTYEFNTAFNEGLKPIQSHLNSGLVNAKMKVFWTNFTYDFFQIFWNKLGVVLENFDSTKLLCAKGDKMIICEEKPIVKLTVQKPIVVLTENNMKRKISTEMPMPNFGGYTSFEDGGRRSNCEIVNDSLAFDGPANKLSKLPCSSSAPRALVDVPPKPVIATVNKVVKVSTSRPKLDTVTETANKSTKVASSRVKLDTVSPTENKNEPTKVSSLSLAPQPDTVIATSNKPTNIFTVTADKPREMNKEERALATFGKVPANVRKRFASVYSFSCYPEIIFHLHSQWVKIRGQITESQDPLVVFAKLCVRVKSLISVPSEAVVVSMNLLVACDTSASPPAVYFGFQRDPSENSSHQRLQLQLVFESLITSILPLYHQYRLRKWFKKDNKYFL